MDEQAFQVQRMLADELDCYKGRENSYVDKNIWEIQDIYIEEQQQEKDKGKVEKEEVILIKLYKVSEMSSTKSSSFIDEEINNLLKYMKFIKSPTQIKIFQSPPYYKLLCLRGEQDPDFWKKVATVLVDTKHNMEILRNGDLIRMFQRGLLHKLFFITINNRGQIIIGLNKKTVATYVVGELVVMV